MSDKKTILIVLLVVAAVAYFYRHKLFGIREGMTGGFSTITGLSFNNKNVSCYPGNSTGSSSPFCEGNGYVLQ